MCRITSTLTLFLVVALGLSPSRAFTPPTVGLADESVLLQWPASGTVLLQRSFTAAPDDWTNLPASLGRDRLHEPRFSEPVFYRLVQLSDIAPELRLTSLQSRLTDLATNQWRRAIDPSVGEMNLDVLPDNGDGALPTAPEDSSAVPFAWATQPGMVRVYHPSNAVHVRAYRLYSSKDSVQSPGEALHGASRSESTARWVDLNEPALVDGQQRFPILDPRVVVEGFEADVKDSLPMPVEWLYVLQDGSLGTVDDAGIWLGDATPSADNPVVGRTAFWMDDETSKLNINVSSEGLPWDVPRYDSPRERRYGERQPVSGEVQRFPGHPATTSLSSVLFPDKAADHPDPDKALSEEELDTLYGLTPRVALAESETFDDDPLYTSVQAWERRAGLPEGQLSGFLTTSNAAPETTVHGRPRMSIWPAPSSQGSAYDEHSQALSSLSNESYHFTRTDAHATQTELYEAANGNNVALYRNVMNQAYHVAPGYGKSLATKYGAQLPAEDYSDPTDFDKDHYQIALGMFQHIRQTNLADPLAARRYGGDGSQGSGQTAGISLSRRDLKSHTSDSVPWHLPSLEPLASGRLFTISEVALVAYNTAQITLKSFSDTGNPTFASGGGGSGDARIIQEVLKNKHPEYASWRGRRFGKEDIGKEFSYIEVGLLIEFFCPSQGYPAIHPNQTVRLLTDGPGYLSGLSAGTGLSINGIPLELWGNSIESGSFALKGPAIMSVDPRRTNARGDLPAAWLGLGGAGGMRAFRFGTFNFDRSSRGYHGSNFLANGTGPLSLFYCQTPVVLREDEDLSISQQAPMQLVVHHRGASEATRNDISQVVNVRFAQPGETLRLPLPTPNTSSFGGWTRRMRGAAQSFKPIGVLDPRGSETIASVSVAHGDYRHVAAKRHTPSELMRSHPLATVENNGHSLMWDHREGGARIEKGAAYAPDLIGRSLVEGAKYPDTALPDFTFDPAHRSTFAPLLGANYQFPIDPSITRDFDTGFGRQADGAYQNAPSDGAPPVPGSSLFNPKTPYFDFDGSPSLSSLSANEFTQRRMAPSPVAMGSLSSAIQANAPWTCLLFRPNAEDPSIHPHLGERGNGMRFENYRESLDGHRLPQMASVIDDPELPPDHLWLDQFWMPTATPEHVCTPFATQGKVNLNHQLMPFTHIKRTTALRAALKVERVLAIPTTAGATYKTQVNNPDWRLFIDPDETLKGFEAKFSRGELFLTESELCEQFLIPEGQTWDADGSTMHAFWQRHRLSGDNVLERPYAGLYSRVTTRSNAFRLHFRVQALGKHPDTPANQFDPLRDHVIADQRGSASIERVLQTDHPDLPAYLQQPDSAPQIERFYRYEVRDERLFP